MCVTCRHNIIASFTTINESVMSHKITQAKQSYCLLCDAVWWRHLPNAVTTSSVIRTRYGRTYDAFFSDINERSKTNCIP